MSHEHLQGSEMLSALGAPFRALAESSTDAIVILDAESRIRFTNATTQRMFGYERDEVLGEPFAKLVPGRPREGDRGGVERGLATDEPPASLHASWNGIELSGLHASGREVPLEVSFSEITLDSERYLTGILRDVTHRRTVQQATASTPARSPDLGQALQEPSTTLEERAAERTEALRDSQALLSGVLDSSLDGIAALRSVRDAAGTIVDFEWLLLNQQAQRLLGPASERFVGRRLLETLPGNRDLGLFDAYARVVETGEPARNVFHYDHDGIRGWHQNIAVKLGDGFMVTFRDVTRAKEEEQVREALTTAQLGTYEYHPSSREVMASAGMEAIYGLSHQEEPHDAQELLTYVHPDDRDAARGLMRAYGGGRKSHRAEYRILRPDGTQRWIHARGQALPEVAGQGFYELLDRVYASEEPHIGRGTRIVLRDESGGPPQERFLDFVYQPLRDADGSVSGIFVHAVDVTEHRRAAEALARAHEEMERRVEERTAELESFNYSVSHDLRAPLLRPAIVSVVVVTAVVIYNDFTLPLYFLPGTENVTAQLTLFSFMSQFATQWNLLFADVVIITIPPLIMYMFFQRQIVAGMTSGSVKG